MSDGPISTSTFFEELRIYIEASVQERDGTSPNFDDLLYGVSLIDEGQFIAAPRNLNNFGLLNDLRYVQQFGRPEGFERQDPFTQFKKAYSELAPKILKEYQAGMASVVDQLEAEHSQYAKEALDHAQDQYREKAQREFNGTSPLSVHSMTEFLVRNIVNATQANRRAARKLDGPLTIDAETEKEISNTFSSATRDPVDTLFVIEGRTPEMRPLRVRNFLRALDPKFFELITTRNNTQLANSSAVPESSMPSNELTKFILRAQTEARTLGDDELQPKHLFLALLDDEKVKAELNSLNRSARKVEIGELRWAFTTADTSKASADNPQASAEFNEALALVGPEFHESNGKFAASKAVQKMLEEYPEISATLSEAGFTPRRFERWSEIAGKEIKPVNHKPFKISDHVFKEAIKEFTRDITEMANDGKLDPIIGRADELEQMKTIMTHRKKKNPMVIGEPGVGKTALLHGYAQDVVKGDVPDNQKGARVLELDVQALIAGTQYRGQFEERLRNIIDGIAERNERGDRPPIILGIDEAHTLVGLGTSTGQAQGASQFIKPALQEGNLWTIMFTTEDEFTKHIEGDGALERRTQTLKVEEPSPEDTVKILMGLRGKFEDHYDITIPDEALEDIVGLAAKYVNNRNFPDKAIDLLDGAGAVAFKKGKDTVDRDAVIEVVARMAKLRKSYLGQEDNQRYAELADSLKEDVFGQDQAVEELADAVAYAKAGLREPNKPVGSYLFVGPTGVGKTELAKSLAKRTTGSEDNLIRIDMSEYMEKHTIGKLVGAPPGYVGYGEEGVLTGAIRRQPNAVIVLDEIEKAHPDVQKLLLGVMDDGKMKDGRGREINFQNATLIMTSNLGAAKADLEANKRTIGFQSEEKKVDRGEIMEKEVEAFFAPEFRGRLDGIIRFNELDKDVAKLILKGQVKKLIGRAKESWGINLELSDKARDTLMEQGFNPKLGARPLKQAIDRLVGKPLAKWLMKNGDQNTRSGMTVTVEEVGENFVVSKGKGDDLIVNPKRITGPRAGDLPNDTLMRLRKRREGDPRQPVNGNDRKLFTPGGPGKRFG